MNLNEGINKRFLQTIIRKGSKVLQLKKVTSADVEIFSKLTGDLNSVHFGGEAIVHGVLLNGFVSAVLGTQLPGPGYVVCEQIMTFPNPCRVGDDVEILVEVVEARKIVVCKYVCTSVNQKCVVHQGTAKLLKFKGLNKTHML
jgi:acyl dehydratase